MNLKTFYDQVRVTLFDGRLSSEQVKGMEALISACKDEDITDVDQIGYVLATVYHETGRRMLPITENLNYSELGLLNTFPRYFSKEAARAYARQPEKIANRAYAGRMGNGDEASGDGWKFRGRGYPQLTGKDNYVRAGKLVKKDLVKNPDLALDPLISAKVITYGMKTGMFTNKKLDDFFKPESADWFNARKIINGTDAAGPIGAYGQKFSSALWKAK